MKKLKILIIKNRIGYSLNPDLEEYKQFLAKYDIEPVFEFAETDWDLSFKLFFNNLWGNSEGLKQRIRENVQVLPFKHNIVMFCYDVLKSGWVDMEGKTLCAWTYPNPMFSDEAFIEMPYKDFWVGKPQDFFEHESTHALGAILRWRGTTLAGCIDNGCPLDQEMTMYQKHFDKLFAPLSPWKQIGIIQQVLAWILTELKKKRKSEIKDLITRIATEYGIDVDKAIKVAENESGLDPRAVNDKGNYPSSSRDRGLYQINDYWHSEVSDAQAFDPDFSARFFCRMVKLGRAKEWVGAKGIFY